MPAEITKSDSAHPEQAELSGPPVGLHRNLEYSRCMNAAAGGGPAQTPKAEHARTAREEALKRPAHLLRREPPMDSPFPPGQKRGRVREQLCGQFGLSREKLQQEDDRRRREAQRYEVLGRGSDARTRAWRVVTDDRDTAGLRRSSKQGSFVR